MKKTRVIGPVLAFSVILITLFAVSCDNFMSDNDDFKKKLKEDVKVANAAKVEVRVQADSGTGTVSPTGDTTVKVDVPFSLFFIPDNSYGFVRWSSYDLADPNTPLVGVVEFPNGGELKFDTSAILKVARKNVGIKPICEKKPGIEDVYPKENEKGIVRNYPIKILFTKDMNMLASFAYSGDSNASAVTSSNPADIYVTRTFKNIMIEGNSGDPEDPGYKDLSAYFKDPVITNNRLISIVPNVVINDAGAIVSGKALPMLSTVRVTVSTAVVDSLGFPMESDYSFKFTLGEEFDQKPPNISLVDAGPSSSLEFSSDTEAQVKAHRVQAGNLWLGVDVSDAATGGGNVSSLHVYWSLLYGTDGTLVAGPSSAAYDVRSADNVGSNTSWLFAYDYLASVPDGVYQLAITATDTNSQTTTLANATKYLVAKDTTAPDAGNVSKVYFDTGWYNASENSITFTPSSAITDSGVSVAGSVPSIQSPNIEWRFMVGNGGWNAWTSAASSATVAIPSTVVDSNAVPITVQFRDDFANTTTDLACPSIPRDKTAPVVTGVNIAGTKYEGKTMVGEGTLNVTVTGSDNLSQVAQFSLSGTNTPGTFISYNPASTNTGTVSISTDEGDHPVYVWVRDAAGNTSPVQNAVAFVDTLPPTIEKFFLNTVAFTSTADNLSTEGDHDIYPNTQRCYFGFIASDTGTGVGSFSYQDDGRPWSKQFDCSSETPITDSDVNYSVENVKRTSLPGGGGQFLVTGILTISDANKLHTVTLRVWDRIGKGPAEATITNGRRVIFDNIPPTIIAQIDPMYGVPTHKHPDGANLYVKDAAQRLNVTAQDQRTGTEDISGIYQLGIAGALTAPTTITLSGTVENASAVYPNNDITLTAGDGLKVINLTASDYAGNTSVPTTVNVILDGTAPVISSLLAMNGTTTISSMGDTGRYSRFQNFFIRMSATDALSGVKTGAYHSVEIFTGSNSHVTGPVYFANGGDSGTLNLPTASGTYIARVTCYDNVTNSQTGEVSFWFDNQQPAFTSLIVYNGTDDASPAYFTVPAGVTHYYIRGTQFNIRAFVTDKPDADTGGSGLASVISNMNGNIGGTLSSWTIGTISMDESPATLAADRWVFIPQTGVSNSWSIPNLRYMDFTTQFFDNAGNDISTPNVIVVVDGVGPTIDIISHFEGEFPDVQQGRYYIRTPAFDYTLTDPALSPDTYDPSGVKEWGLSTDTDPDNTGAGVTTWYKYEAPYSDTDRLSNFLAANPGEIVNFFAKDHAGNVLHKPIVDYAIYLDNDKPEASPLTLVQTDGKSGAGYTTNGIVNVSGTLTETGSGLSTMTFGDTVFSSIPAGSLTISGWAGNYTVASPVITLAPDSGNVVPRPDGASYIITGVVLNTSSDGPKEINLTVVDKVSQTSTTVATGSIIYDHIPPYFPVIPVVDCKEGNSGYYINSTAANAFSFSANDATSGVTGYLINNNTTAEYTEGFAPIGNNVSSNGSLLSKINGSPLFLHVRDAAGLVQSQALTGGVGVTLDSDAPSGVGIDLNGADGSNTSRVIDTNRINITFTEALSGLRSIVIDNVDSCTPSIANATIESSSYSGTTLTILLSDYPRGPTIELSNIKLLTGDGDKTVVVTLTDAAGNSASPKESDTIVLDTQLPVLSDVWMIRTDGITDPTPADSTYTIQENVSLHLRFTEKGSGIQVLTLTGATIPGSAVIKSISHPVVGPSVENTLVAGTHYTIPTPGGSTIIFNKDNKLTGDGQELSITGIILTSGDGTNTVTVTTMNDWVGNDMSPEPGANVDTITLDTNAPEEPVNANVTISTLYNKTGTEWYVGGAPKLTLDVSTSDATSGIAKYLLSNNTTAPAFDSMTAFTVTGKLIDHDVSGFFSTDDDDARYLYVFLADKAGKISSAYNLTTIDGATGEVVMDATDPDTPEVDTDTPPEAHWHSEKETYYTTGSSVDFVLKSSDVGAGLAGYSKTAGTPTHDYGVGATINVTAGIPMTLYAVDNVDNVSDTGITLKVETDTVDPTDLAIGTLPDNVHPDVTNPDEVVYYTKSLPLVFTPLANDAGSGVKGYSTDSSGASLDPENVTITAEGSYTIYVFDNLMNRENDGIKIQVILDNSAPSEVALGTAPTGAYKASATKYYVNTSTGLSYTPTATENGSGLQGFSKTAAGPAVAGPISYKPGTNLELYVWDMVNNVSAVFTFDIVLDDDDPATPMVTYTTTPVIADEPNYYTTGTFIDFKPTSDDGTGSGLKGFSTTEGSPTIACSVGGTIPVNYNETVTIYAVDNLNNVSDSGLEIHVFQDTAGPGSFTMGTLPSGVIPDDTTYYTKGDSITFTPSSVDAGVGILGYSTDPAGISPAIDDEILLAVGGPYDVYAFDEFMNRSEPISAEVIKDTAGPETFNIGTLPSNAYGPVLGTIYVKSTPVILTPTGSDGGCGLAGFAKTIGGTAVLTGLDFTTMGTRDIYAFDKLNNNELYQVVLETDNNYDTFTNITITNALGAGFYMRSDNNTLYSKSAPSSINITPGGGTDNKSGHKGYALTSVGTPTTGEIAVTGGTNIYAFDNLGNYKNVYLNYQQDPNGPTISSSYNYNNSDTTTFTLTGTTSDGESGLPASGAYSWTASKSSITYVDKVVSGLDALTTLNETEDVIVFVSDNVGNRQQRKFTRKLTSTSPVTYTFTDAGQSAAASRISVGDYVVDGRRKEKIYTSPVDPASFIGLTKHSATSETAKILQTAFGGDRAKGAALKPLGANDVSAEAKAAKVQNASVIDLHEAALARARADLERVDLARQNRVRKTAPADDVKVTVDTPDGDSKVVKTDAPERIVPDMPERTAQTALESRIATVPASVAEALGTGSPGQQPRPAPGKNLPRDVFMPFCLPGRGRKQEDADGEE